MKCNVCLEFPEIADKSSSLFKGCSNLKNEPLKSHDASVKHQRCMEAKRAKMFPGSQPMDVELSNMAKVNAEKILCLFNTAYFIVKGNMAFLKFPDLMRLRVDLYALREGR